MQHKSQVVIFSIKVLQQLTTFGNVAVTPQTASYYTPGTFRVFVRIATKIVLHRSINWKLIIGVIISYFLNIVSESFKNRSITFPCVWRKLDTHSLWRPRWCPASWGILLLSPWGFHSPGSLCCIPLIRNMSWLGKFRWSAHQLSKRFSRVGDQINLKLSKNKLWLHESFCKSKDMNC